MKKDRAGENSSFVEKTRQCTPEDMENTYQNGQKTIERTVFVLLSDDRMRFHALNVVAEKKRRFWISFNFSSTCIILQTFLFSKISYFLRGERSRFFHSLCLFFFSFSLTESHKFSSLSVSCSKQTNKQFFNKHKHNGQNSSEIPED